METISKIGRLFTIALIVFSFLIISSESSARKENSSDLKEFKITIERTNNGLKMQSEKNSAWIDLGFHLANNKPQAIDEFGMTQLENVSTTKDPQLADFLFTISISKDQITLTGLEGTAWNELSFSLEKNRKQSINQFGMTE